MTRTRPPSCYVNQTLLRDVIERALVSHDAFAEELGISRSHWSVILNHAQALSKNVRRRLLTHPRLQGIPESELWGSKQAMEAPCARE